MKAGVQRKELEKEILKKVLDKQLINEALVSLIVLRNLPFRAVEWPELHALLKAVNPMTDQEIISSHSEVNKKIHISWIASQDVVRKKLQSALSKIHLSLDVWTSLNKILFLGICTHFVDHDSQQLLKALIGLRPLLTHGGDHQAEILIPVLQEFGIARKIGYCIGDNHGSNDRLCRAISLFLQEKEIKWNPAHYQIRCNDHILNLAVQAFLFDVENAGEDEAIEEIVKSRGKESWRRMGPLGKLHNIVIHIHATSARIMKFKKLADRGLSHDNDTRWNSWYLLLKVAIEKESAVDAYTKRWIESLRENFLTSKN